MKILQLCKKFPYPPKDGESIAITNLSKAFHSLDCEVSLLAMNTTKHFFDIKDLPDSFDHYRTIDLVHIDNSIKIQDAFFNLFSKESYHISRFISKDFEAKLKSILQKNEFDVIQLETLYIAPYIKTIRKYSTAIIAMRAHNVEHEIWTRVMNNTSNGPKKWYLQHLVKKLKDYEIARLNDYDLLVPITAKDLTSFQQMGFKKEAVITPIGISPNEYQPNNSSFEKEMSLSFIGSLDWMPNQEGLIWFFDQVWNPLLKKFPKLTLQVAGRNTPKWLKNKKLKNVEFLGEIPDAPKFINQHSLMLVPLLAGSGMRAKILEGMALGKVVLTTSLGLEGIPAENRKEVLVADTAKDFIEQIDYCYRSNGQLIKIGKNAHSFVLDHYDYLSIAKQLLEVYKTNMVELV